MFMKRDRQFASDNYSGICPEAWAAMAEANIGHEVNYGNDTWTQRATDAIREVFETDCEVFFVFNGTSANSLSLAALCRSYHSILCHELAHVETAECGAPEFFSNGSKLLLLQGKDGKIDPAEIERAVNKRTDIHYPKPGALSLTQVTEAGTVYTPAEIKTLTGMAKKRGLRVQMDGARFANAIATLGIAPADVTWRAGVDVLCFGGTKNGIGIGEAVVFLTESWHVILIIAVNRAVSWRRRCAFFPRRGWACWREAPGYATLNMRTKWPNGWRRDYTKFPAQKFHFRFNPMLCLRKFQNQQKNNCAPVAGNSTLVASRPEIHD